MNAQDIIDKVAIDPYMIPCLPQRFRRAYTAKMIRLLADAVDNEDVISISSIQWDGSTTATATVVFAETGIQTITLNLIGIP